MNKAIIISGNLAQDHEFIYPYYRLLEAEFQVDVCLLEGKPVKGILGTTLPPNKDQAIKTIDQLNIDLLKKIKFLLKEQGMTISGVKKILNTGNSNKLDEISNKSIRTNNLKNKISNISQIVKSLKKLK